MAIVKTHSKEHLCRMYGTLGYYTNGVNTGLRHKGQILWFGYSPVDGYVLISETKTPGKAKYNKLVPAHDRYIRQWILNDTGLYDEARHFGGGGDDEMYEKLPEFIKKNRDRLIETIDKALMMTPAK